MAAQDLHHKLLAPGNSDKRSRFASGCPDPHWNPTAPLSNSFSLTLTVPSRSKSSGHCHPDPHFRLLETLIKANIPLHLSSGPSEFLVILPHFPQLIFKISNLQKSCMNKMMSNELAYNSCLKSPIILILPISFFLSLCACVCVRAFTHACMYTYKDYFCFVAELFELVRHPDS